MMISCIISAISFSITRMYYYDDSATIATISEVLISNKIDHKILKAAQKFKKNIKEEYRFVRFCKEIFDKHNFDKF